MIVSLNPKPSLLEFKKLMARTDTVLNQDAKVRHDYYIKRGGNPLEDDVKTVLEECAKGTPFENSIEKVSGQKFPDIIAAKYFGVEVKSTKEDHWTSTGSSILESTRIAGVERIYMTFGKLGGNPIEFLSKPYEQCLHGIAVTHMPRYLINMKLNEGGTIFDKMGISYDELRTLENPIAPVARYYRSQLREGERLWWAGDSAEETVSATIRFWRNLNAEEKQERIAYGFVYFPEIFAGKYDNYALWLTSQGIVSPNVRDIFSSGGQESMRVAYDRWVNFPGVYRRVKQNLSYIKRLMAGKGVSIGLECSVSMKSESLKLRLLDWADKVSKEVVKKASNRVTYDESMGALCYLFFNSFYEHLKE